MEKNNYISNFFKISFILLLIYLTFKYVLWFFSPFIIGYILCLILYPLFKVFYNLKIPKPLCSLLSLGFFIFIISFLVVGIIGQIIKEGKEFSTQIPFYISQVKDTIESLNSKLLDFIDIFPNSIKETILNLYENSIYVLKEFLGNGFKNSSVQFIKKIPNIFIIALIAIISCFLILNDKENIENFILKQIPEKHLGKINIIKDGILKGLIGYIKAQFIIMLFIGTICFIGLSILKAPYALFIAFVIGIIDALPILGSGFILWPWCVYNIIAKNYGIGIGLIIIYVVIVITRQFIEPKIVSTQIGIHPLATLISMYIGLKVFGILGIVIGPCIIIVLDSLRTNKLIKIWK